MAASVRAKTTAGSTAPVRKASRSGLATKVLERVGTLDASGARQATVHEAKTHLSRLLAEVEAGGTVVITRRGKPVAKLAAVDVRRPRIPGSMKGQFEIDDSFFDPLPDEELRLWGEM